MVGGCDLVGQVVEDSSGCHKAGDRIVINGWGVGTDHYGGFSRFVSLRSSWALRLPPGMTSLQAASIGTAGYTAMLCVQAMERSGLKPRSGSVLVTGATGGVGSISVILLTKLGYEVVAVSGKAKAEDEYLNALGPKKCWTDHCLREKPDPLERSSMLAVWTAVVVLFLPMSSLKSSMAGLCLLAAWPPGWVWYQLSPPLF